MAVEPEFVVWKRLILNTEESAKIEDVLGWVVLVDDEFILI